MVELESGEFIYNADGEQFLVAIEEDDESYLFAVHGWQRIGKDRLDEYLHDEQMSLYTEDIVMDAVSLEGDEEQRKAMQMLQTRFLDLYGDGEMPDVGPHNTFVADDTKQ